MNDENNIYAKLINGVNFKTPKLTNRGHYNGLTFIQTFYNLTAERLVVSFRDGTFSVVEPDLYHETTGEFIVFNEKMNHRQKLRIVDGIDCDINMLIRDRLNPGHSRFELEDSCNINDIRNAQNGVYLAHSDILVISENSFTPSRAHPFCRQRSHHLILNRGDEFNPERDINVNLRLITDGSIDLTKHCVFHDRVLTIKSKRSMVLKPGFYITGLCDMDAVNTNNVRRDKHYPLDVAMTDKCPVQLFNTVEEACKHLSELQAADKKAEIRLAEIGQQTAKLNYDKSLKDAENKLLEQETKLKEQEIKLKDQENKLLERTYEKEKIEQAQKDYVNEIARINKENALLEQKMENEKTLAALKEQFALKTIEKKNFGETMKVVGVAVAATATILKIIG